MARRPRLVVPGQAMHVIQRGNDRQAVFYSADDYQRYLEILFEYGVKYECQLHAYVLMTNHIHLLLTPLTEVSTAKLMQAIGRKYVRYVNGAYRRSGTLWEGRYKSAIIDSEQYLLTCSRYIELNPVRAGMVTAPGDYRWSSYQCNALGQGKCEQLTPHALYQALGKSQEERQAAYRGLFAGHVDEDELTMIRDNTQQGVIIGGERFQDEIENMLQRRVRKDLHGGDRKSKEFRKCKSSGLTP